MTQYVFINPEDIPDNLDPGEYTTSVVKADFVEGELVIKLRYLGKEYTSDEPTCLFPLIKN
jgi:hypothetical protein